MRFIQYLIVSVIIVLVSCKNDDGTPPSSPDDQASASIIAYLDSMGLRDEAIADSTGIYLYRDGDGTEENSVLGQAVSVFYVLSILAGDTLDIRDSTDSDTLIMKQGSSAIYPVGVDQALGYMHLGEKWTVIIPPSMAYGDFSSEAIPAYAILHMDIEVIGVASEDSIFNKELAQIEVYLQEKEYEDTINDPHPMEKLASGIVYQRMVDGGTDVGPTAGSETILSYRATFLDDQVFSASSSFQYNYGEGEEVAGLDVGVGLMNVGDSGVVVMPSKFGYHSSAAVIPGYLTDEMVLRKIVPPYVLDVDPYRPLVFEIGLKSIQNQ